MSLDPKIVGDSYDRVAADYAVKFAGEFQHKPFDRLMLDWLVARVPSGTLCDLGCGPGQVAAYLHGQGAAVIGLDLSAAMISEARALNPEIPFAVADMGDLGDIADGVLAGIAAFYSIIHQPRERVPVALASMHRVLEPGGTLLLTFHVGEEVRHFDQYLGQLVDLDFVFFTSAEMRGWLEGAGFTVTEVLEREAYPGVEVATRRAYLWARKGG
ncbi:MAG: Methylase involved in ubiquinone/menaquinone biosynthesis [Devosia sp.]|nr:Methylase involved in ubiquinone/menaquinone biosynthesis [Devosia sp.]